MPNDYRGTVHELLQALPTRKLDALKRLFWSELNYERAETPISTRAWPDATPDRLAEPPLLFATTGARDDFHVIYCRLAGRNQGQSAPLSLSDERTLINKLLPDHPYALFIFSDAEQTHWHFVNVKLERESADARARRVFRRITIGPHERLRTASERISMLDVGGRENDSPVAIQRLHDDAFNVEAVTRKFFRDYQEIFEAAEEAISGIEGEARRLFTQRLFNRLLFITFLERKGWLTYSVPGSGSAQKNRSDYLQALWEAHAQEIARGEPYNFYRDRLHHLFFAGLNTPHEVNIVGIARDGFLQTRIGDVPYLNGGLFEQDEWDRNDQIVVPDAIIERALADLLYRYNFTVTESTPLDIEVAVDPEMLGKIFEELITGRHETGSYYTPKQVVSFMGKEALKGYLQSACPRETAEALAMFVDAHDASRLRNPEQVLDALKQVKICDPACGSGAYLVGLLHELLELRDALFTSQGLDALTVYQRKLEIIQNNLYGVDIDPFAVNIARLRLWLSLIVDFEGDDPPPLPNLDFKIEVGDSLTGRDPSGGLQPDLFQQRQVEQIFHLKSQYMMAHGNEKLRLRKEIEELRAHIAAWIHGGRDDGAGEPACKARRGREDASAVNSFDWAIEFAEVFVDPQAVNTDRDVGAGGQPEGGFDIVVANPPYVRQELIPRGYKEDLKRRYPSVYGGVADLYVYFYARAIQLLRPGGVGCFISSNKWLRAGYGKKLRSYLGEETSIQIIVDFGDLPIFAATAYPCIVVFRKNRPSDGHNLRALEVKDMAIIERLADEVQAKAWEQPQSSLRETGWTLIQSTVLDLVEKLREVGQPLEKHISGKLYRGITTGLNKAFVIDEVTRTRLIEEDSANEHIIKPWLQGRNIDRWRINWTGQYLIWAFHGIQIDTYPSLLKYLSQYRDMLSQRWEPSRGQCEWYELRPCDYYNEFEKPKIVYPDIALKPEFTYDSSGAYGGNTMYILPTDELYLLGILNSSVMYFFYSHISSTIRGDYLRFIASYMQQVPIPEVTLSDRAAIESLVTSLLAAKGVGSNVAKWESELNAVVYETYGLTNKEIKLIEEGQSTEASR